jgi:hypothetical protein
VAVSLSVDVPQSARMYCYYLGGKDFYPADEAAAEKVLAVVPGLRVGARANRAFLHRAARVLVQDGVDQFLDIGTGMPVAPNLHEVVQGWNRAARVVYVDHDPLVLVHARALLTGSREGRTGFVDADVRDPAFILEAAAEWLDLSRPVAVSLGAVLHFIPDIDKPAGVVADLMGALAPGSCLVLSHGTGDFRPVQADQGVQVYQHSGITVRVRSRSEITALVPAGMEIAAPGVVSVHRWWAESGALDVEDGEIGIYGLLARKR